MSNSNKDYQADVAEFFENIIILFERKRFHNKNNSTSTLIFGCSGSGKTALSYLLSHQELQAKHNKNQDKWDMNTSNDDDGIGNGTKSKTIVPNIFPRDENDCIIDFPGFFDTKGVAQELLNSYLRKEFQINIGKARFVLVTEQAFEQRGQMLIRNLEKFTSIFKTDEDFKKTIHTTTIVFSKTEMTAGGIIEGMENLMGNNDTLNKRVRSLFESLIKDPSRIKTYIKPKRPENGEVETVSITLQQEEYKNLEEIFSSPTIDLKQEKISFKLDQLDSGEQNMEEFIKKVNELKEEWFEFFQNQYEKIILHNLFLGNDFNFQSFLKCFSEVLSFVAKQCPIPMQFDNLSIELEKINKNPYKAILKLIKSIGWTNEGQREEISLFDITKIFDTFINPSSNQNQNNFEEKDHKNSLTKILNLLDKIENEADTQSSSNFRIIHDKQKVEKALFELFNKAIFDEQANEENLMEIYEFLGENQFSDYHFPTDYYPKLSIEYLQLFKKLTANKQDNQNNKTDEAQKLLIGCLELIDSKSKQQPQILFKMTQELAKKYFNYLIQIEVFLFAYEKLGLKIDDVKSFIQKIENQGSKDWAEEEKAQIHFEFSKLALFLEDTKLYDKHWKIASKNADPLLALKYQKIRKFTKKENAKLKSVSIETIKQDLSTNQIGQLPANSIIEFLSDINQFELQKKLEEDKVYCLECSKKNSMYSFFFIREDIKLYNGVSTDNSLILHGDKIQIFEKKNLSSNERNEKLKQIFKDKKDFKQVNSISTILLDLVKMSKISDDPYVISRASAAMTALNYMGYDFQNESLEGIKIPTADLSNGKLYGCNLRGAQLTGVQFEGCEMDDARFEGCDLRWSMNWEQEFRFEGNLDKVENAIFGVIKDPDHLQHLKELEKINLDGTMHTGDQLSNMKTQCLAKLKVIKIDDTKSFTNEKGFQILAQYLSGITDIEISLREFNEIEFKNLFNFIHELSTLKKLQADKNQSIVTNSSSVMDENIQTICTQIKSRSNLNSFSVGLNKCVLSDVEIQKLADAIKPMRSLKNIILNLNANKIGDDGLSHLAKVIEEFEQLETLSLNLSWNESISEKGFKGILEAIGKLKLLKSLKLNFSENQIKDEGLEFFSNTIKCLESVQNIDLNLQDNLISGEGVGVLLITIEKINRLPQLKLNLQDNQINDDAKNKLKKNLPKGCSVLF